MLQYYMAVTGSKWDGLIPLVISLECFIEITPDLIFSVSL